jgi:arginine utilization regulatory protein
VRADGMSIMYNDRMSKLEKMRIQDVIGKNVKEVQSHIPDEESTLIKALKYKLTTPNYHQTFINQYGKEITTINTTVPVIDDSGEVIAAVEIARDVTDIKKMSNAILDLQSEAINTKSKNKSIKTYTFDHMVCCSENFIKVLDKCKRAAKVNASVLIYGETGTGKELIAQSVHYESDRRDKPFLAQNCAALPESLLEGILFGTAKGGFTGAIDREGLFEQANGGTLLLDEISAMPYDLQSKLLRVLQENYIRRVGGTEDIPVDVRIIATINEQAEDLIEGGKLRQDLYYRLKIIEINVPPLRERKSDIFPLVEYFLKKYNKEFSKQFKDISKKGREKLLNYDYPGNVRELEHIIMSIVSMSEDGDFIEEDQLELPVNKKLSRKVEIFDDLKDQGLEKYLDNIEKALITEAVENSGGMISKAARQLGLKRQTLEYKLKKYKIKSGDDSMT